MKGTKADDGKPRYDLLPPRALHETVEVLTFSAKKYGADNWRTVEDRKRRYFAAALRHMFAWWRGQAHDPETQRHHLAHATCCLMFMLDEEV